MMTVNDVSKLTGVSIRTLRFYDKKGLLSPARRTDSGYRLYDEACLSRLQQILLLRELEFSLDDIGRILDSPAYDMTRALDDQITILTMKKQHIENLIVLAKGLKLRGVDHMDFDPFDVKEIDEYTEQAKQKWVGTPQWKEFEEKSKGRTSEDEKNLASRIMDIFVVFGKLRDLPPDAPRVREQVETLRAFLTANFYECTDEILLSLGRMYAGGGEFTQNIDKAGGEGTAEFTYEAIKAAVKAE